jgi:IS5 family transposase
LHLKIAIGRQKVKIVYRQIRQSHLRRPAMIIDRYVRPENFTAPSLSDPILQELDWILDDPKLFALVRQDLAQHYPRSKAGRRPVPVEVTLRLIVLRRRKKWSYRDTEQEVRDSHAYQAWARVHDQPVPDFTTLNDLERVIRPRTLHQINDRVLVLAQTYRLTQGFRLRVDSSVTETNIRYPLDNGLLLDGVRVLSRLLERAEPWLSPQLRANGVCSSHVRSAKRRARQIGQLLRSGQKGSQKRRHAEVKKRLSPRHILNPKGGFAPDWHRPHDLEPSLPGY